MKYVLCLLSIRSFSFNYASRPCGEYSNIEFYLAITNSRVLRNSKIIELRRVH